jgi:hypothetical protein
MGGGGGEGGRGTHEHVYPQSDGLKIKEVQPDFTTSLTSQPA